MTVREMNEILSKMPQHAPVFLDDRGKFDEASADFVTYIPDETMPDGSVAPGFVEIQSDD